jgi:hypothetical protein
MGPLFMAIFELPQSVRYVKNGLRGGWWEAAKSGKQVHLGWSSVPLDLLINPSEKKIEAIIRKYHAKRKKPKGTATTDFRQLMDALNAPSQHLWITFENGYLWWCTVHDGAIPNPNGKSATAGHFWLQCDRPWSNRSLKGTLLVQEEMPGGIRKTASFRSTICTPHEWSAILRLIRGEPNVVAALSAKSRGEYEISLLAAIQALQHQDFEELIDLILFRSGWTRTSRRGKTIKDIDIEAENPSTGEHAFVQIKSVGFQRDLNTYYAKFQQRAERNSRMFFVFHKSATHHPIKVPNRTNIHVWDGEKVAELAVKVGLGEWVESKLA